MTMHTKHASFVDVPDQCREWIKHPKNNYWKTKDENHTSGNSPSSCPFYEEFDHVLGMAPNTEPSALHDSLVRRDGDLLTLESSLILEGSKHPMRLLK